MRVSDLFEDVHTEASTASNASRAFRAFCNYVERLDGLNPTVLNDGEKDLYAFNAIPSGAAQIAGLPNLLILLGCKRHGRIHGSFIKQPEPIRLHDQSFDRIVVMGCMKRFDPSEIKPGLFSVEARQVFIHEMTHAIDYERTQGRMFHIGGYDRNTERDKYANDPAEVNAIYHEIAAPMTSIISEMSGERGGVTMEDMFMLYDITGDPVLDIERFLTRANSHAREMFSHLNQHNKRSVLKRLYRLHQAVMNLE